MSSQTRENWLANLKPGDQVVVSHPLYRDSIKTVERTTKTLVVLKNGDKYRKQNGYVPGNYFYGFYLCRPTKERLTKIALELAEGLEGEVTDFVLTRLLWDCGCPVNEGYACARDISDPKNCPVKNDEAEIKKCWLLAMFGVKGDK